MESVPSCCLSSPLLCTSPQFGSERVPICRGYRTWFPPQREEFPVKTPLPQPHKPIPTPLHSQQGKWRQVSMAGPHIPGDKLLKALGFPVLMGSVSKLSVLQRELTEELQNAIAYMTMNISHHLKRERTTSGLVKWREKSSCWSRSCLGAGNRANDLNPAPFNTSCPAEAAVTS